MTALETALYYRLVELRGGDEGDPTEAPSTEHPSSISERWAIALAGTVLALLGNNGRGQ